MNFKNSVSLGGDFYLNNYIHWGVDILFLLFPPSAVCRPLSAVRCPTWFPDILGNSSYPIFTKFGMQVYWLIACMGLLLVMIAL